jgi:hypothetical protein
VEEELKDSEINQLIERTEELNYWIFNISLKKKAFFAKAMRKQIK